MISDDVASAVVAAGLFSEPLLLVLDVDDALSSEMPEISRVNKSLEGFSKEHRSHRQISHLRSLLPLFVPRFILARTRFSLLG